ncbi:Erlin-1 [Tetrabaena socialis]|uniref:Erlin-1 n=1 Tax=Tetrabaena socialis TaxID=47790 RepID=A0A2J8A0U4_9CHLO|nr:Erlin-1 [Tetrabaena socialis]|eukprot:PNH06108.1 Erlin-1 [Tetrabaena socialis]
MQPGPSNRADGPAVLGGPAASIPAVRRPTPFYLNLPVYVSVVALFAAFVIKTAVHQIPETDKVMGILCGTKGGVTITFDKIEVVNRLKRDHVYDTILEYGTEYDRTWIYDKIHHEINQFCSSHTLEEVYISKFDQVDEQIKDALQADCNRYAPGIEIIAVRVTKPSIPDTVSANYVAMEVERTKALVALERQRVMEREAEAERVKAVAQAQRAAETSAIRMRQLLAEKEAARQQAAIDDAIFLAKQRALADAEQYRLEREAAALHVKLTPQFLEYALIQAVSNNTKIFFGDRLPSLLLDQRAALRGAFAAYAPRVPAEASGLGAGLEVEGEAAGEAANAAEIAVAQEGEG